VQRAPAPGVHLVAHLPPPLVQQRRGADHQRAALGQPAARGGGGAAGAGLALGLAAGWGEAAGGGGGGWGGGREAGRLVLGARGWGCCCCCRCCCWLWRCSRCVWWRHVTLSCQVSLLLLHSVLHLLHLAVLLLLRWWSKRPFLHLLLRILRAVKELLLLLLSRHQNAWLPLSTTPTLITILQLLHFLLLLQLLLLELSLPLLPPLQQQRALTAHPILLLLLHAAAACPPGPLSLRLTDKLDVAAIAADDHKR